MYSPLRVDREWRVEDRIRSSRDDGVEDVDDGLRVTGCDVTNQQIHFHLLHTRVFQHVANQVGHERGIISMHLMSRVTSQHE